MPAHVRREESPRLAVGSRPLVEVLRWARRTLERHAAFELDVNDPDGAATRARADTVDATLTAAPSSHEPLSWRAWVDFAELLGCRAHTPQRLGPGRLRLRFSSLGPEADWHGGPGDDERYDAGAAFATVRKLEHPGFLLPLLAGLERVRPPDGARVLVLGCHRGDEIAALGWLEPPPRDLRITGVDRSASALAQARSRFPEARFLQADVADLPDDLGRYALVVAIDVLQSPRIDGKAVLRRLVQAHLEPVAALLLGLPNSRFHGDEVVWGARTRNYRDRDLSLLVRDLAAYRRYLQQHGFVTHVGGRYDLLLGAWRRG